MPVGREEKLVGEVQKNSELSADNATDENITYDRTKQLVVGAIVLRHRPNAKTLIAPIQ